MTENQLLRYKLKDRNFNKKLMTLDCETSGLNLCCALAFEIAWLFNDQPFQYFPFFPDIKVSDEAARVNGFNFDVYKSKAIDKNIVCDKLDEVLFDENNIIVWQNGLGYDCMILDNFRKLCGRKSDYSYLRRTIDTKANMAAIHLGIHPPAPIGSYDYLAWMFRMLQKPKDKKHKTGLDFMLKYFEIDRARGLHEGLEDVGLTRDILLKQIWKLDLYI